MANPSQPGLRIQGQPRIDFGAWANSPTERYYYGDVGSPWRGCALKQHLCMATTVTGVGCSRIVVAGFHYCWQHLESISHLSIGPTSLNDPVAQAPFNFLGLFAVNKHLPQGGIVFNTDDFIANMFGEVMTPAQLNVRYPGVDEVVPYGTTVTANVRVDSGCLRPAAAFGNDCHNGTKLPFGAAAPVPCNNNADIETYRSWMVRTGRVNVGQHAPRSQDYFVMLVATRPILNGEEIFVNYGDDYWGNNAVHKDNRTGNARRNFGSTRRRRH